MNKAVDMKCPTCGSFLNLSLVARAKTVGLAGTQIKFQVEQVPQLWCNGVTHDVALDGWSMICEFEVDGWIGEDGYAYFKPLDYT